MQEKVSKLRDISGSIPLVFKEHHWEVAGVGMGYYGVPVRKESADSIIWKWQMHIQRLSQNDIQNHFMV